MLRWASLAVAGGMMVILVKSVQGNELIEPACASLTIPHFYQNGHCFTFHNTSVNISVAESTCAEGFPEHPALTGGRLAVLPNLTIIDAFLQAVNVTSSSFSILLGAFQEEPTTVVDANWYWKENPVQTSSVRIAPISAGQPPWSASSSQPNDGFGDERCASLIFGSGLYDLMCSWPRRFACEFPCDLPAFSLRPNTNGSKYRNQFDGLHFVKQEGSVLAEIPFVPHSLFCGRECHNHPLCTSFTQYDNGTCILHYIPKGHKCYREGHDPKAQLFEMT